MQCLSRPKRMGQALICEYICNKIPSDGLRSYL